MLQFALKPNDIIDVVAPSSGRYDVSTEEITKFIASLGYRARVPDGMQLNDADPFSANTDEARYQQLLTALQAPDSNVIWCFKGGYGSARLLPSLDRHDFSKHPKLLLGFSDITALFLYFNKKYDWPSVHSRMVGQYVRGFGSAEELALVQHVLTGNLQQLKYELAPGNNAAMSRQEIRGELIGGNLTLIECSLGTNWAIDTRGKILFIEDVNIRGYALHRALIHLSQAGVLDNILALIIGDIACVPEPDAGLWMQNSGQMLCETGLSLFLQQVQVPVFRSNNFGHGVVNYPLVLGVEAVVSMDSGVAKLTYAESSAIERKPQGW